MERDWILRLAILTKFIAPSVMVFLNHWHRPEGTDIYSTKLDIEYYGKSFDVLIWFWGFFVWFLGFLLRVVGRVFFVWFSIPWNAFTPICCTAVLKRAVLASQFSSELPDQDEAFVTLFQLMDKVAEVFLFGW